tara:strand:- start:666 stop:854 length:189 start_codon:yes stop_codon:yes gene_type:complete
MSEELNIGNLVEGKHDHVDYYGLGTIIDVLAETDWPQGYVEVYWLSVGLRQWEQISDLRRCA